MIRRKSPGPLAAVARRAYTRWSDALPLTPIGRTPVPDEFSRLTQWRAATLRSFAVAIIMATVVAERLSAQTGGALRTAILRAEDARGKGPEGIVPILDGLNVPALREVAIRALGRLQDPGHIGRIAPHLSAAELTATAADALAQSVQGLRADSITVARRRPLVDSVFRLLRDRGRAEQNATVRGVIARSIGRLPFDESRQLRDAEAVLLALARLSLEAQDEFPAVEGVANGFYTLGRARRTLGPLSPEAVQWLRQVRSLGLSLEETVPLRRLGWLALTAAGAVDRRDISGALSEERDPQVRRLAIAALPNVSDSAFQRSELARSRGDRNWMVRLEWIRVYRQRFAAMDCSPLLAALTDTVHHVRLAALDALGGPCPDRDTVVAVLRRIVGEGPDGPTARRSSGVSWHARAHALLSLARIDAAAARDLLHADRRHPVWQVRMYVARGAAAARDSALLTLLAFDSTGTVREAAIEGLASTVGHVADLVYVRALQSRDYHVVLAAARALRGSPARDSVLPAVLDALGRLTNERRQTSRDPRMELLARVRELGTASLAGRLTPLLTDVDDLVAREAAAVMTHLDGERRSAAPSSAPSTVVPPSGQIRVRVTMAAASGGGTFEVLLDADRTPLSAARVQQLIRDRYYDGLTFHRVVPNFVIQGGSPGMNEYVGDGPFMRDEPGLVHHLRGTVGISTRGHDTGDAQWFINLVDNYRLDHDYTVFATVVDGMDVVDRILEGDVMESVRLIPLR